MTLPKKLSELRKLLANATPGPWEAVLLNDLTDSTYIEGPEFCSARSGVTEEELTALQPQIHADAKFIVAAVNNLAALLDVAEAAAAIKNQDAWMVGEYRLKLSAALERLAK